MSLVDEITPYLPTEPSKPPLVTNATIEWEVEFGSRPRGYVIVWTARHLTSDGGHGWCGLDGKDMQALNDGIESYVVKTGANLIVGFRVREWDEAAKRHG